MSGAAPDPVDLAAIIDPILADPTARARRMRALEQDPRSESEIAALLSDFDALVALLRERFEVARDVSEPERPVVEPPPTLEEPQQELLELDDAELLELDEDDIVQIDDELSAASEATSPDEGDVDDVENAPTRPRTRNRKKRPAQFTILDASNSPAIELLYDDILWLFSINDFEAALISLERLLVMATLAGEVKEFVKLNEAKLLNLYEGYMGPFDKVPAARTEQEGAVMPADYLGYERLATVMELVDGARDIAAVLEVSPLDSLQTCAALNQLHRSGMVTV